MRDEEGLSIQPDDGEPVSLSQVLNTLMAGTHGVIEFLAKRTGADREEAIQVFADALVENEDGYNVDTVTEKFTEAEES